MVVFRDHSPFSKILRRVKAIERTGGGTLVRAPFEQYVSDRDGERWVLWRVDGWFAAEPIIQQGEEVIE